ncbi:MAG TPA: LptE family protein [Flavisolibacter sp.]|nr:LptE family protein [Flavisolibacter sp.]
MKKSNAISFLLFVGVLMAALLNSGCHIYSFKETAPLADSIKTVRIQYIENRAPYVNPQLSPNLTERLKQKILNQTRLSQTNNEDAHLSITGYISDYSPSTVGISNSTGRSQTSVNRLTVTVHITLMRQLENKPPQEFDVSRSFDFSANQSLQQAESQLLDEMVRNLSDEIFNRLFSNW